MSDSPIDQLLEAMDRLDAGAMRSLLAPDCRFMTADGRQADGIQAASALMDSFIGALYATTHTVTSAWHPEEGVWIAEIEATYELQDRLRTAALPRAFVMRCGPDGITDLRVYGAHERPLTQHRTGDEGMMIGERWVPPL